MGDLVGLNYAHRYGGVVHLLLLAPVLTYLSGERFGTSPAQWQAAWVGKMFHYGFNRGAGSPAAGLPANNFSGGQGCA
jgi:hypothetical protein